MTERIRISLSGLWLITSLVSLILPVFIPTYPDPQSFIQNVIGTSTVTMFVISFPSSLFGIPLLFFAQTALGIDPNTIGGMYLNLFLLFVLGLIQWFWIVPRVWRNEPDMLALNLPQDPKPLLSEAQPLPGFEFFDSRSRTPLERVLHDEDQD